MAKIIVILLLLLFCAILATIFVWGILIIVKEVIELWREIKE